MVRAGKIAATAEGAVDRVSLPYAERWRRRGLLRTEGGEEILLDLAEAAELREGQALTLDDGRLVAVLAAAEPLAEVRGPNLARLAWHIGNRHTPCEIGLDRLLIQRDHVLEAMLVGLGAAVRHVTGAFCPEGGAYGHGRTHGHAHGTDPMADPDAHLRGR
ncbi:MAG: urease accessory protein UreE [Pikeienuella sp.]